LYIHNSKKKSIFQEINIDNNKQFYFCLLETNMKIIDK